MEGEPVVFALRDVLERAHDVDEAVALLKTQPVMVSHLVLVADAKGRSAIVERAPDVVATVRTPSDPDRVPLTNHFEGPLASDPKNLAVLAKTTTGARRERLDEILRKIGPHEADVPRAVAILRDHDCAKGVSCPLGDRREIDALDRDARDRRGHDRPRPLGERGAASVRRVRPLRSEGDLRPRARSRERPRAGGRPGRPDPRRRALRRGARARRRASRGGDAQ